VEARHSTWPPYLYKRRHEPRKHLIITTLLGENFSQKEKALLFEKKNYNKGEQQGEQIILNER